MSIANNIKNLRESKKMTQAKFGEIAGVSDKAVSTWENGSAEPRMGAIQKLADYFGVSICSIVGDDDQADALFIEKFGKEMFAIVEKIDRLDSSDRDKVDGFVSALLADDKYKRGLYGEKVI